MFSVAASMLGLAWAGADCVQSDCLPGEFSLLQRQIALEQDEAEKLPTLSLLGRSFYSKDPVASAKFMERYFSGSLVENPSDMIALPGAKTAGAFLKSKTEAGDYMMLFAHGEEKDLNMDVYVDQCQKEFNYMTSPEVKDWSHWGDLHDGLADYVFDLENATKDGMPFFHHGTVTRSILEGTALTFELKMALLGTPSDSVAIESAVDMTIGFDIKSEIDRKYLMEHTWDLDEPCRVSMDEELAHADATGANDHLWWKSTFAVANARTANQFAEDMLGATLEYCPFPYPPNATCTGALWVNVAPEGDQQFQLHFVEFNAGSEHDTIVGFHEYHAKQAQALSQGCMLQSMYNNVAFNVAALDPFVDRLRKTGTPFLAMKTSNGRYALLFAFTGNEGIVIQLQSDVLTKADAADAETVSQACAAMVQH